MWITFAPFVTQRTRRYDLLACGKGIHMHLLQLKRCSSSEVAAMIEDVLRHCTDIDIEKQYVDSHGQS